MMGNLVGLVIIGALFQFIKMIYNVLIIQMTWFVISIVVFAVCTGGIVYTILQNMPMFKYARDEYGGMVIAEYIMPGQRGQWGGEGFIASGLFTLIGLSYLFLSKIGGRDLPKEKMRIYVIVSIMTIYILQSFLLSIYRIKAPWYNPTFDPPDYY
jgi:hypothetical protein